MMSHSNNIDESIFDLERKLLIWTKPSKSSSESMPLGNGDVGLNVWVEEGGDLLLYISKTDAWDENARLVKVGKVRIKFAPNPFNNYSSFNQILNLARGEIEISCVKEEMKINILIWVDVDQPVIRLNARSNKRVNMEVILELWRNRERELSKEEIESAYGMRGAPHPVKEYPDVVLSSKMKDCIVWCHRNNVSIYMETMINQGLEEITRWFPDPLLNRTFGGLIRAEGLILENEKTLKSVKPRKKHFLSIYLLTAQTKDLDEWLNKLKILVESDKERRLIDKRTAHRKWWRRFWKRSWIYIDGDENCKIVTRGYILQRFMNAIAGLGAYPIKFNGSIFTFDHEEKGLNADYRRWGGPYWFQNTRLIYWPMLKSGDFDMMQPLFRMYLALLPMAETRVRIYFGHRGAYFPETLYFWGAYALDNYGWKREGKHVSYVENGYIRYHWEGGIELIAMMLDYYFYTLDEKFAKEILLPLANAILQFYDEHHQRDENGKIRFEPSQALETWWNCVNPLPDIAGLTFVLNKLLRLPPHISDENNRLFWQRLLEEMPPIPVKSENGKSILAPAQEIKDVKPRNCENPELYAVFPFRIYGVGRENIEVAQETYFSRRFKGNKGWQQDVIQAAYLGLTLEAQELIIERFSDKYRYKYCRFPAFWGPNFDWVPDQTHGNVGMIALQAMLLQCVNDKIILFPAWPKNWNVRFKLHAPYKTIIECIYQNGKIRQLKVTPKYRRKDVVIML
ncbi:MAG: DUF5703 domain-containing protein [Candidatus Bathyarchaeia archaeon]